MAAACGACGARQIRRADRPEALPEAGDDPDNGQRREPSYSWQAIPPEIADLLNSHLGLPFKPMKATP